MKKTRGLKREITVKDAIAELSLLFPEILLQLPNRGEKMEIGKVIRLISDANFDAGEYLRHLKEVDDRKGVLKDWRDDEPGEGSFTKNIVRSQNTSSISAAVLYRKNTSAGLRRQKTVSSSQGVKYSSQIVSEVTGILLVRCSARLHTDTCEGE